MTDWHRNVLTETHLEVSAEGEVLPEGMALESVVGEDSPQVRMVREEDAEHVEDFSLVPVGGLKGKL